MDEAGPGARLDQLPSRLSLPGVAGAAAAVAARTHGAGAGGRAVGRLRDREGVARLRVRDHGVAAVARALHLDLAVGRAEAQAGGRTEAARELAAAGVGVVVRVAGLQLAHHVASVGLGRAVLGLGALAEEVRQGDRGKDADDQNDDEELDKGETGLLRLNTRAELPQHVGDLLMRDWVAVLAHIDRPKGDL